MEQGSIFIVPDRKRSTLREIVKSNRAPESVVISDAWQGYARLTEEVYCHKTVNHSKKFINAENGAHTQGIERVWVKGKDNLKRHRRHSVLLQTHLDELSWRKRHSNGKYYLIEQLWHDVHATYDLTNYQ